MLTKTIFSFFFFPCLSSSSFPSFSLSSPSVFPFILFSLCFVLSLLCFVCSFAHLPHTPFYPFHSHRTRHSETPTRPNRTESLPPLPLAIHHSPQNSSPAHIHTLDEPHWDRGENEKKKTGCRMSRCTPRGFECIEETRKREGPGGTVLLTCQFRRLTRPPYGEELGRTRAMDRVFVVFCSLYFSFLVGVLVKFR